MAQRFFFRSLEGLCLLRVGGVQVHFGYHGVGSFPVQLEHQYQLAIGIRFSRQVDAVMLLFVGLQADGVQFVAIDDDVLVAVVIGQIDHLQLVVGMDVQLIEGINHLAAEVTGAGGRTTSDGGRERIVVSFHEERLSTLYAAVVGCDRVPDALLCRKRECCGQQHSQTHQNRGYK